MLSVNSVRLSTKHLGANHLCASRLNSSHLGSRVRPRPEVTKKRGMPDLFVSETPQKPVTEPTGTDGITEEDWKRTFPDYDPEVLREFEKDRKNRRIPGMPEET